MINLFRYCAFGVYIFLAISLTAFFCYAEESHISMDFKDASLKDVLKVFSMQSGLNFVASEEIKDRKLTLYMDNVPVEDAMENILKANGLTYEQEPESNIFIVKESLKPEVKVETITRVYRLRYARVSTSSLGISTSSLGALSSALVGTTSALAQAPAATTGTSTGTTTGTAGTGGVSGAGLGAGQRVITGIDKVITGLLSKYGSLVVDERTNSLIITDIESQFPTIEETIAKIDVPTPQVMIEAELLEVSIDDLKRMGIEWGGSKGELFVLTGSKRKTAFPFSENIWSSGARMTGSSGAITEGSYDFSQFIATLRLLVSQGSARFLARPKVLVLDNESAVIKISANTAVGITSTSQTQTGTVISTAERMETGITLKVTPQINEEGFITMLIEPSVIRPVASEFFPNQFVDPQLRGISSVVRMRDGDTIAIGGLLRTDDTKTVRKVPVLGDIPVLGAPFRDTNRTEKETELIVFITPRIVQEFSRMASGDRTNTVPTRQDRIKEALERAEKSR